MRKACSLMREGYVVSHVASPYGERVDIVDIRTGALRTQATSLAPYHRPRSPPPWTVEDHNDARFILKDRNGCALEYARQLATHNQKTVRKF